MRENSQIDGAAWIELHLGITWRGSNTMRVSTDKNNTTAGCTTTFAEDFLQDNIQVIMKSVPML